MPENGQIIDLSNALADRLRSRGWTCATAESCSAGLIGHIITAVAGSSDYYLGGVIAYSNQAKMDLLQVKSDTLNSVGAVSAETATEMAAGARKTFNSAVGIATTGIAGPGGGTDRKPVGLIYIAVATPDTVQVQELRLNGSRLENIKQTAHQAIRLATTLIPIRTKT